MTSIYFPNIMSPRICVSSKSSYKNLILLFQGTFNNFLYVYIIHYNIHFSYPVIGKFKVQSNNWIIKGLKESNIGVFRISIPFEMTLFGVLCSYNALICYESPVNIYQYFMTKCFLAYWAKYINVPFEWIARLCTQYPRWFKTYSLRLS